MSTYHIRLATPQDAAAMAAIYAPYVRDTVISFELEPPTAAEMARRMEAGGAFPWLVCQAQGQVAGYAYAGRMGERWGYDWSAAVSIYIDENSRQAGMGRALYTALHGLLTAQGIRTAYAGVAVPNPPSEAFHQKMGYTRQGCFETVGYKFGRVAGVAWYAKALLPVTEDPPPPRPFSALPAEEVAEILKNAQQKQNSGE